MSSKHQPTDARIDQLLLDRAAFGLSADEQSELQDLLCQAAGIDITAFDRTAAAIYLALAPAIHDPLPADLAARIVADGQAWIGGPQTAGERSLANATTLPDDGAYVARPSFDWASGQNASGDPDRLGSAPAVSSPHRLALRPHLREALAWLAAAACLLLAVSSHWRNRTIPPPTVSEQRLRLLSQGSNVAQIAWQAQEDPAATNAAGDVVWSDEDQLGFMRFCRLAANDPGRKQYQLWIFDAARDDSFPVDGGVFDIPREADEVVIPIRATLPVVRAKMFAITVEEPGGVVVSSRERLPLLAVRSGT